MVPVKYQDWGHENYRRLKEREANPPSPELVARIEQEAKDAAHRAKISRLRRGIA